MFFLTPIHLGRALLLSAALLLLSAPLHAQLAPRQTARIDSLLAAAIPQNAPGIAVGIIQNGHVVLSRTRGMANLEHRVPVTDSTAFNIASNAKQFTALLALQQAQAGHLQLDTPLADLLPQYRFPDARPVSLRHLLTHTSGIRDVYDLWALQGRTWWQLFLDNADAWTLLAQQSELNFPPGSSYLYSNSNYLLLAQILEKTTGEKFPDLAARSFAALGMSQTQFIRNYMDVVPNRARPYGNWNGWKEYPSLYELHGDGGLFSTLHDQLIWEKLLQQSPSQLPAQLLAHLGTGAMEVYGAGVMFDTYGAQPIQYHDGNTGAYNASFLRFPKQRLSIVLLSNNGTVSSNNLARQIADIVLADQLATPRNPTRPATLATRPANAALLGTYATTAGTYITVREAEGRLYRDIPGRDPVELLHQEGNLFGYANNPVLKIAFFPEKRQFVIYHPTQQPITGNRMEIRPARATGYGHWNGTYLNAETGTRIVLADIVADSAHVTLNSQTRTARMLLPHLLSFNGYTLTLEPEGHLLLAGDRIRRVRFTRMP